MKHKFQLFFKVKTLFGDVYFSINQTDKGIINSLLKSEIKKIVEDVLEEDEDFYDMKNCVGLSFSGDHNVIRIRDYTKDLEFQKTLIHEINHCVYYMLFYKNIEQCSDNTETFSYLFEFLYGEVIEEINRTLKKIKTKVKKKPIAETQHQE